MCTTLLCVVDVIVQWCSQGDLLAVAGMERTLLSTDTSCPPPSRNAIVKFYNVRGEHIYTLDTPAQVTYECHPRKIVVLIFSNAGCGLSGPSICRREDYHNQL